MSFKVEGKEVSVPIALIVGGNDRCYPEGLEITRDEWKALKNHHKSWLKRGVPATMRQARLQQFAIALLSRNAKAKKDADKG